MFLCKWWARKQISIHRDNKVVLYCITSIQYTLEKKGKKQTAGTFIFASDTSDVNFKGVHIADKTQTLQHRSVWVLQVLCKCSVVETQNSAVGLPPGWPRTCLRCLRSWREQKTAEWPCVCLQRRDQGCRQPLHTYQHHTNTLLSYLPHEHIAFICHHI